MHSPTLPPSPPKGVEPTGSNGMAMSLLQGERVQLSRVDAFADGVAVKYASPVLYLLYCSVLEGMNESSRRSPPSSLPLPLPLPRSFIRSAPRPSACAAT